MRAAFATGLVMILAGCIGIVDDDPQGPEVTTQAPTVADCQDGWDPPRQPGDVSREYVNVTIEATGPFKVGVPVPVADPETTFASWAANASVLPATTTDASTTASARGNLLVIEGDGDAVLCSHSLQYPYLGNKCCAEAFLHAAWTTASHTERAEWIDVWVPRGQVTITVEYAAISNWCGRNAAFEGTDVGDGWVRLTGEDGAWCE